MAPPSHASAPTPARGPGRRHRYRHRHRLPLPLRRSSGAALLGAVVVLAASCSSSSNGANATTTSSGTSPATAGTVSASGLPGIRHVFVIVLENQGYDTTFGAPFNDPYLASTLPAAGALLTNYYGIGHFSNDNYVAMVSGQAPNPLNQADCLHFVDFPATATVAADGQISDTGCVFPGSVTTVANQLTESHLTWKGYMQDMGNVPTRESASCGHPAVGAPDLTETAVPGDGYASRHDPFVYFHSIIDNTALLRYPCGAARDPLGDHAGQVRGNRARHRPQVRRHHPQPQLHHTQPLLRRPRRSLREPAGLAVTPGQRRHLPAHLGAADHRLAGIQEGRAPRDHLRRVGHRQRQSGGGHRVLQRGAGAGLRAPRHQRSRWAAAPAPVLLSPFIRGGTVSAVPYNHFSTLATIEDIFGLPKLGQAKTVSATFGKDVFNRTG